jgi:hypothetical protein
MSEPMNEIEIFNNLTVEDAQLNPIPVYYESLVDNPFVSRMDGGVSTSQNVFKIVDFVDFDLFISDLGSGEYLYRHNLGYKPFTRGSYYIHSGSTSIGTSFPIGLRGTIPENRYPEYGAAAVHTMNVTAVTESTLTVQASLGGFEGTLKCRLFLFREKTK